MPLVKYGLVDGEGNPVGSIETGDFTTDNSGEVDANGYTYQAIDFDKDISTMDSQWYYDSAPERGWSWRPARPSEFHNWTNKLWVLDVETFWKHIRAQRDRKLTLSDWTQLPDAVITEEEKVQWATYRQSLRNLPANNEEIEFIADITWPLPPQ